MFTPNMFGVALMPNMWVVIRVTESPLTKVVLNNVRSNAFENNSIEKFTPIAVGGAMGADCSGSLRSPGSPILISFCPIPIGVSTSLKHLIVLSK